MPLQAVDDQGMCLRLTMLVQMRMVPGQVRMVMRNGRRITGRPKAQDRNQTERADHGQRDGR